MNSLDITLLYLLAAVLGVVACRSLKLPPMLGYLVVGVLIGPNALAIAQNSQGIRYLAEFGVVFLMFVIGLEFSLPKLRAMRRQVFGLGLMQVLLTMAVVIPITGFLLQRINTRPIYMLAMAIFSVGTLICAVSPGLELLVFGRVIQATGTAIMLGYGLQTVGLQSIPSSQSAFITALYVPFVPLLQWLFMGKRPGLLPSIGIMLAFTGLMLLSGPNGASLDFSPGEIATLISTVAIAAEIILISSFAGQVDVRRVTVVQLAVTSLLAFAMVLPTGEALPGFSWLLLASALGLGAASAAIQVAMNWAQKSVSPTRATLIYAGEPVWAGIVGRIAGERLPAIALVGAGLIVAAVIVSELKTKGKAEVVDEVEREGNPQDL